MGEEQIVVKIGEKEKTYPAGVSFLSIAQEYQDQYEDDIVLALYNNRLLRIKKDRKKRRLNCLFLQTSGKTGKSVHTAESITLLNAKAVSQSVGAESILAFMSDMPSVRDITVN